MWTPSGPQLCPEGGIREDLERLGGQKLGVSRGYEVFKELPGEARE